MRILSVSPYYEPEGGGLERYAHAILSRLAARGHEVRAVALTRGQETSETMHGVHLLRRHARVRLGNTPIDPGLRSHLGGTIREWRPDVIVAHTPVPFPAEMAYLAAKRHGIPLVVTYHAGRLRGSRPGLDALAAVDRLTLERRMLSNAHALIGVSPYVRDNALARHKERVRVIPPGVDTRRFSPGAPSEGQGILFVGPVDASYRWKGIDVLWRAVELVQRRFPDARLTVVGEGDRFHELTEKAYESGRGIRLAGRLPEHRLIEEYRRAAVVVLPSTTDAESFGMVLAEANACGRPVIGSRIGGIPDFVRDRENGLLANPSDPVDLADKIQAILRDPAWASEMGARGREIVERDHDWDRLALRTEETLTEAIGRHRALANGGALLQRRLAQTVQ